MTDPNPAQAEGAANAAPKNAPAPAETPKQKPAAGNEPAAPPEGDKPEGNQPEQKKPEKTPAEKENARLAYEARRYRQERDQIRAENEELRRNQAKQQPAAPPEPKLEDFPDYQQFMKAWNRWDRKHGDADEQQPQGQPQGNAPQKPPQQQNQPQPANDPLKADWDKKQAALLANPEIAQSYVKTMVEMAQVVDSVPGLPDALFDFAHRQTQNAPEFLHDIAKDADFYYELANTPIYLIGPKLQGRLSEINARKQPPKQVPESDPPSPVRPRGKGEKPEHELSGRELRRRAGLIK